MVEPLEVTGSVRVKLFVASDAPDTDFTAKLVDIYPDGREIAILNGIQRVKFRKGFDKPDPLPPGSVGELTIDCWSISIIFNKGHRIGLQISSSNWPRYEINPNTGADLPTYTGQNKDEETGFSTRRASHRPTTPFTWTQPDRAAPLTLPVAGPNLSARQPAAE